MKRVIAIFLILAVFLISLVSSEIIINQQPKELYNLGDSISIPVTIKSLKDMSGIFQMNIICNGQEENFYKNGVGLSAGEEKRMESMLVLTNAVIGELKGDCKIKALLNTEYVLTNDFVVSDLITVYKTSEETEFEPGKNLFIKGNAVQENGEGANGFVEMEVVVDNSSLISQLETVKNGFFMINATLPADMKAGAYLVKIKVYEKDIEGFTTNYGILDFNIIIKQIPRNLEIIIENPEVEPGTRLKAKTILHDQTGDSMPATSVIKIKNNKGEIIEQTEKQTEELFELPIAYNEPSSNWTLTAESRQLTSEAKFVIKEKEEVLVELINKTLIIENRGNVPYNKSVLVKIENESLHVDVYLDIDEVKKYLISAPDGDYEVEILTDEGDKVSGTASLTGKSINIKELSIVSGFLKKPMIWGFFIFVLGLSGFLIFRKVRKKRSFGFMSKTSKKKESIIPRKKESLILPSKKNKAELSLSIKGDKQDVSLVCLKIKNFQDIESKKDSIETFKKISGIAEEHKAVIYENHDTLFFILVPAKTKTFRNELPSLQIAQKVKELLNNHNKLFKSKIDFGICIHYGTIIAKQEESMKFMALGTLISAAKKIASLSKEEILLSEKSNERIQRYAKTHKKTLEGVEVHTITQMKDAEEHKKFISNFLKRMEKKD